MSELVTAVATSHTPLLVVPGARWGELGAFDPVNEDLYANDGRHVTFEQLLLERPVVAPAGPEVWERQSQECQESLDRLALHLSVARPDAVVIVGDDQQELFSEALQPTIAVFHGARFIMEQLQAPDDYPFVDLISAGYGMAGGRSFEGHPTLARAIIDGLMAAEVDVTTSAIEPTGTGFGHAFGFVMERLLPDAAVPVVPILLNTFYPPNQPTPSRCLRFGHALRHAIETCELPLRVAVVASGGLSHFVVNEALDRAVLDAICSDDQRALGDLPPSALNAGSSEIRNWLTVAGAAGGMPVSFCRYVPAVRSEAGTGVGMAFVAWGAGVSQP